MKYIFMLLSILLSPIAISEIDVSEFKVGLADFNTRKITEEVTRVEYTENGTCTAAKKRVSCLQFGFTFQYKKDNHGDSLLCEFSYEKPERVVDINEVKGIQSEPVSFELQLPEVAGRYFYPMYFYKTERDKGIQVANMSCLSNSHEVFSFRFSVDYGE